MNGLLNPLKRCLRSVLLISAAALMLAACGNPEKDDLLAIAQVMKETGYTPQMNRNYQTRLQSAKTEVEARQVVGEMLAFFEGVPPRLDALQLKSPEVAEIRDGLSQGIGGVVEGTRAALAADPQDQAAVMAAQKTLLAGQQKMLEAQTRFMALAGKHGLEPEQK